MKKANIILICILSAFALLLTGALVLGTIYTPQLKGFIQKGNPSVELVDTQTLPLDGARELQINARSLDCRLFLTEETEVKLLLYSSYAEPYRHQISASREGERLLFEAKSPRRIGTFVGFNREYAELYLPRSFNGSLKFQASSGSLHMEEGTLELGLASLQTSSGVLHLDALRCDSYDIRATSGMVRLESLVGTGKLQSNSGSVRVETLEGEKHSISCTSGIIHLGNVRGDTEIESNSGSIQAETLEGKSHSVSCTSGIIKLDHVSGNLNLRCNSGSARVQSLVGDADMKGTSGILSVREMAGAGSFESNSGSIRLEELSLTGDLKLKTTSGSIRVQFAGEPSAVLEAQSGSGVVRITGFASRGSGSYKTATLGAGEYRIDARANSGSIRFSLSGDRMEGDFLDNILDDIDIDIPDIPDFP